MGHKAKWRKIPEDELREIIKNSYSNREVAKKLGYKPDGGGTMAIILNMYKELDIDTSHFKGKGWNKDNFSYESFVNGIEKKNGTSLRRPLEKIRGCKCEECGISEWRGKEIRLEVHHIDGNHQNNELSNLKLLCPNCHSQTENFRKPRAKVSVTDEDFVEALRNSDSISQALRNVGIGKGVGNYERAYNLIYEHDIKHLMKNKE